MAGGIVLLCSVGGNPALAELLSPSKVTPMFTSCKTPHTDATHANKSLPPPQYTHNTHYQTPPHHNHTHTGIFGMNMKSTLEMSVFGFWGVTISIVVGCFYIFLMIMRYTQKKRIL